MQHPDILPEGGKAAVHLELYEEPDYDVPPLLRAPVRVAPNASKSLRVADTVAYIKDDLDLVILRQASMRDEDENDTDFIDDVVVLPVSVLLELADKVKKCAAH